MDRFEGPMLTLVDRHNDGENRPVLVMPSPRVASTPSVEAPPRPRRPPPIDDAGDSGWMTAPPSLVSEDDEVVEVVAGEGLWALGVLSVVASFALLFVAVLAAGTWKLPEPGYASPARIDAGFMRLDHDPAGASTIFRAVLATSPHTPSARFGLGEAELALGHYEEALTWLCPLVREPGVAGASAASVLDAHRLSSWCR